MRFNIFFMFSLIFVFSLSSIEVGGHLTENTTWSPDNNPYLVTSVVYVESGVTLTIMPGTIIKFNDALFNYINNDEFWYNNGEEPLVKYIKCYGKIVAEGTEQDSIIFTRMHDIDNYHWGTIYLTPSSDLSVFKHCHFEYSAFIGISMMEQPEGALVVDNGFLKAENCSFIDNIVAIKIEGYSHDVLIKECEFNLIGPLLYNQNYKSIWGLDWDGFEDDCMLIAHNTSNTKLIMTGIPAYVVFNYVDYEIGSDTSISINSFNRRNYIFGNYMANSNRGVFCTDSDTLYIKKNQFVLNNGGDGIDIDDAYIEISENSFINCGIDAGNDSSGKIYCNHIYDGYNFISTAVDFYNNIITDYSGPNPTLASYNVHNLGNLFYNNDNTFDDSNDCYHTNCVILNSNDLFWSPVLHGIDIFRNCIIDFELEYPLIDGGGNIIVDSLQAQEIFLDIQNGDFHLAPGSIAIDAGFDTLGNYYPFDMDYNHRVWDGDNNGTAIIDIGPYEYGAPAFGGIQGITYDPTSGDFVDYVLIKINNEAGEFTFSDSVGCFQYKLPAGIYDVYAERVFFDDAVEYQIEVFDEVFTQLDIPMSETVEIDNNEIIPLNDNLNLTNYPNPFNPETIISFSIQSDINIELSIFNIKGQKVTTLINEQMQKGKHSTVWSGCDQNGHQVSSGIYFYKLKVGNQESVKRMLLLK